MLQFEYYKGGRLNQYIRYHGGFGEKLTVFFAFQLVNGLIKIHDENFAHLGINARNILVNRSNLIITGFE